MHNPASISRPRRAIARLGQYVVQPGVAAGHGFGAGGAASSDKTEGHAQDVGLNGRVRYNRAGVWVGSMIFGGTTRAEGGFCSVAISSRCDFGQRTAFAGTNPMHE